MSSELPLRSSDTVLLQVGQAVAPLISLLVAHGVDHPRFAALVKRLFVEAAQNELRKDDGAEPTLTAISLRSGLQRRDVKAQLAYGGTPLPPKALTPNLPMQALARWISDPAYSDADGMPRSLPLRSADADQPAFEQLAESLSKDIHAPALLDELVRLGLVRFEDGFAQVLIEGFVPPGDQKQLLGALGRNLGDHARAAVANVLSGQMQFLEYSLIADELRPDSAEALHQLARKLWRTAYKRSVTEASAHIERDKVLGFDAAAPETRVRFGVYFYSEPVVTVRTAQTDSGGKSA